METAIEALRIAQLVLWIGLALAALEQYRRHRRAPEGWIAATFGLLGAIALAGRFLPEHSDAIGVDIARRVLVATLVLFPYFLFRFTDTLRRAAAPWKAGALIATAALSLYALAIALPERGEPRGIGFNVFLVGLLVQWTALSGYAGVRLWRAGTGQPRVTRRRMRTLAMGAIAMSAVLIVAGTANPQDQYSVRQLVIQSATLFTAPLFLFGFAPPRFVVWFWRMKDEQALREIEASLLRSSKPTEVAEALLPHAVRTVGGSAGVLLDRSGESIGAFGEGEDVARLLDRQRSSDANVVSLPLEAGTLLVQTSPYAPFFGKEELSILNVLASLTDLALIRAETSAEQLRVAEELRIANETMREFVAIASHDLRTPLAVVVGLAQALDAHWERFDDGARREQVEAIQRQSTHLSRLVEDLLAVSSIESRAIHSDRQNFDLAHAVDRTVRDLESSIPEVHTDVPEGLRVFADPEHLTRMLHNYLMNARDHGRPPFTIRARETGARIEIRVFDAGEGVPEEFRARMFEKFARGQKTKARASQGTGLGLAIVRGLARAGGGEAWYEHDEHGHCFAIALPRSGES